MKDNKVLSRCIGIAIIMLAFFVPMTITMSFAEVTKQKCIEQRGNWENDTCNLGDRK